MVGSCRFLKKFHVIIDAPGLESGTRMNQVARHQAIALWGLVPSLGKMLRAQ